MPHTSHPFVRKAMADEDLVEYVIKDIYCQLLQTRGDIAVIDGGAHAGFHTEFFAKLRNCRLIYAVEAHPALASELPRRLTRACAARVQVVAAAMQADPDAKTVNFMLSDSHPGRSGINSIFQFDRAVSFRSVTVPATTIDAFTKDRRYPVRFIKLDLEGGEFNAIRGGRRLLREDRPVIAMENSVYAPRLGGFSVQEYFETFAVLDYVPITFLGEPMTPENMFDMWYAWAAPVEGADEFCRLITEHVGKVA